MNWYLVVKFLHIVAVIMMVGGVFARQLVRGVAKKTDDVKLVASHTHVARRLDMLMVIPGSNAAMVLGIILALMTGFPIFGFLQGATKNWLLVSNILIGKTGARLTPAVKQQDKKASGHGTANSRSL